MSVYKIDRDRLTALLQAFSQAREVIALEKRGDSFCLVRAENWSADSHTLGAYRPIEPLKSLLFPPRESIGSLDEPVQEPDVKAQIVVGVKNCDLSALEIHDHVFLKTEPVDPFYAVAREKTLLVSCDCTDCREVCFCTVMGEKPYPTEGFDINISPTESGYVVETGSELGEEVLKSCGDILQPADDAILQERDKNRAAMVEKVTASAAKKGLQPGMDFTTAVRESYGSEVWEEFAEDCVECGACNFVCCTCHCFLLADGLSKDKNVPARVKQWDSCLLMNFARVAGGANPRKHRAARLYNRFSKKFLFFPENIERYACDGCGRCIEACTGKIDIREVLKKVVK